MVRVHWTVGGAAPPDNACTQGTAAQFASAGGDTDLLHFAVEGNVAGYVSLGFPEDPNRMYDADMVLGWVDSNGRGHAETYHVTSLTMQDSDAVRPTWAMGLGVVEDRVTAADGSSTPRTVLCFSRRASEPRARSSPLLDLQQEGILRYSWATHFADDLIEHPAGWFGAGVLDVRTGGADELVVKNRNSLIIAHGVLMSVAWVLLLPLGAMLPAHRWAVPAVVVRGKAIWFWGHMLLQFLGLALFLAGFILAVVRLEEPDGSNTLHRAHAISGYVVCGLVGVQFIAAFIRPDPGTRLRLLLWNPLHMNLGRLVVLLAWATVFTGAVVHHRSLYRAPLAAWVAPTAAVMGVLLLADVLLRLCKPAPPGQLPPAKSLAEWGRRLSGRRGGQPAPALQEPKDLEKVDVASASSDTATSADVVVAVAK